MVSLAIKEGWHIHANPTGVALLSPTVLVLDSGQAAIDLQVDYPAGQTRVLGSLGTEKVALYDGNINIAFHLTLPPDIRAGKTIVKLRLKYQACNDRACMAPSTLAIPLEVMIGRTSSSAESKP